MKKQKIESVPIAATQSMKLSDTAVKLTKSDNMSKVVSEISRDSTVDEQTQHNGVSLQSKKRIVPGGTVNLFKNAVTRIKN